MVTAVPCALNLPVRFIGHSVHFARIVPCFHSKNVVCAAGFLVPLKLCSVGYISHRPNFARQSSHFRACRVESQEWVFGL